MYPSVGSCNILLRRCFLDEQSTAFCAKNSSWNLERQRRNPTFKQSHLVILISSRLSLPEPSSALHSSSSWPNLTHMLFGISSPGLSSWTHPSISCGYVALLWRLWSGLRAKREELIIQSANNTNGPWKEYQFKVNREMFTDVQGGLAPTTNHHRHFPYHTDLTISRQG